MTVVNENRIHFALRFSSLPSLRENRDDICMHAAQAIASYFLFVLRHGSLRDGLEASKLRMILGHDRDVR